jgi:hypothetical protein
MGWRIEIEGRDYEQLRSHLEGGSEMEQVAFLLTAPYGGGEVLHVARIQLIDAENFNFQSGYHVDLADDVRPNLIKRAWEAEACVIEAHSHLHGPSRFSPSDLAGFDEWVPHMRWRLRHRPYAALVFAPDDFDALVWDGDGTPAPLDALVVADSPVVRPTGITYASLAPKTPAAPEPAREERPTKKSWWRRLLGR